MGAQTFALSRTSALAVASLFLCEAAQRHAHLRKMGILGSRETTPGHNRARPPDRGQIGRAAWRYVHTMATDYPENPSRQEQEDAVAWLRAFVQLYPCGLCAREFVAVTQDLPPRLNSREAYTMWWCEAHNRVRDDLSQTLRRCEPASLLAAGRAGLLLDEFQGQPEHSVSVTSPGESTAGTTSAS